MSFILGILYLLLPAYIANMTPVFAAKLFPRWNTPADFGLEFRGKRLFGDHKTVRGIVCGVIAAILVAFIQINLLSNSSFFQSIEVFPYSMLKVVIWGFVLWGFLLGMGALLGDCVKSFFKRQLGIAPGRLFMPFDQLDFVLGALFLTSLMVRLPVKIWLGALFLSFILHLVANMIGYLLGLKEVPW